MKSFIEHAIRGWRKATSLLPIYGLKDTFLIVIKNIFWLEKMCRLEKDLSVPDKMLGSKVPLRIVPYTNNNLQIDTWVDRSAILAIRGNYGLQQFKERFERGDMMFAAYWEDKFVGFVWIEFPPVNDAGYPLKENEAYTYDGWTFDTYRGNRVLAVIQQSIITWVRNNRQSIRTLVTHVADWNKPSLTMDQKADYMIIRQELLIVMLGYHKKIVLRDSIPPKLIVAVK